MKTPNEIPLYKSGTAEVDMKMKELGVSDKARKVFLDEMKQPVNLTPVQLLSLPANTEVRLISKSLTNDLTEGTWLVHGVKSNHMVYLVRPDGVAVALDAYDNSYGVQVVAEAVSNPIQDLAIQNRITGFYLDALQAKAGDGVVQAQLGMLRLFAEGIVVVRDGKVTLK